jgi:hypothetical protein
MTTSGRHFEIDLFLPFFIRIGSWELFWQPGDEFTLCRGMKTLIHWRKVDALGGWVNCKASERGRHTLTRNH